jgi:hypothetical protein
MNIYEILDELELAYPEDVFPELTEEERAHLVSAHRGVMDRISASMGRHLVEVIRRKLADGAGEEDRLRTAAREWLAYYDKYGAREFNRRFGTKEVHGDEFVKFLREFLTAGEALNPSDTAK